MSTETVARTGQRRLQQVNPLMHATQNGFHDLFGQVLRDYAPSSPRVTREVSGALRSGELLPWSSYSMCLAASGVPAERQDHLRRAYHRQERQDGFRQAQIHLNTAPPKNPVLAASQPVPKAVQPQERKHSPQIETADSELQATTVLEFKALMRLVQTRSGLNSNQLAKASGIPVSTVYHLLAVKNTALPTKPDQVERLMQACGLAAAQVERVMRLWAELRLESRARPEPPPPASITDLAELTQAALAEFIKQRFAEVVVMPEVVAVSEPAPVAAVTETREVPTRAVSLTRAERRRLERQPRTPLLLVRWAIASGAALLIALQRFLAVGRPLDVSAQEPTNLVRPNGTPTRAERRRTEEHRRAMSRAKLVTSGTAAVLVAAVIAMYVMSGAAISLDAPKSVDSMRFATSAEFTR